MTWMKAGEFECEDGSKAVVLGRVPDPNDTPKYPWTGYVKLQSDPKCVKPMCMKISWSEDGKTNCCYPQYNLKPPVQVRYMAVHSLGCVSTLQHSLQAAATAFKDVSVVIAFEFMHGQLVNQQKIAVFLPDSQNCWKEMALEETHCKHLFGEFGHCWFATAVKDASDCGCTPPA